MHDLWSFGNCAQGGCAENWRIVKKLTEWVCPCNISYGMQMKENICLTGLLLGTNHGCFTTNPIQSALQCNGNFPLHLLVQPNSLSHQLGILCWPCAGILREYFQPIFRSVVKMWILCRALKLCWSFGMQFAEKVQANWQELYWFIMTLPDPIQPEQTRREFKNYSGNSWISALQPGLGPQWLPTVWSATNKNTLMANVFLMTKRLKRRYGSDWDNNQKTSMLRDSMH
jgi:hypothetical protein